MTTPMSREHVALTLNNLVDHGTVDDEDYQAIMAHDAALRQRVEEALTSIERNTCCEQCPRQGGVMINDNPSLLCKECENWARIAAGLHTQIDELTTVLYALENTIDYLLKEGGRK